MMGLASWTETGLTNGERDFLLDALRSKRFTAFASVVLMDPRRQAADALQRRGLVTPLVLEVPCANLFVLTHKGWIVALALEHESIKKENTAETIERSKA